MIWHGLGALEPDIRLPSGDLPALGDALTDGLITKGFYGAVFDGQFIYYCPTRSREDRRSVHGHVLRYNSHMDFRDPAAYSAYDAGHTDGLRTAGFYGSAFDGRRLQGPSQLPHLRRGCCCRYETECRNRVRRSTSLFRTLRGQSYGALRFRRQLR